MKRPFLPILFLAHSFAGIATSADPLPSALRVESLGSLRNTVIQAPHCTIRDVQISDQNIFVLFTGRWLPSSGVSDSEKNGFSIARDRSTAQQAWALLARRFRDQQGKPATITITMRGGWAVRGGIPLVSFPTDSVEIISATTK